MRKISLTELRHPDPRSVRSIDKKFIVCFGNGSSYAFSNKVHAEKFLVDASEILTGKFIEVNEMLIDARILYQKNWFFMDNYIEADKKLREDFIIIDTSMLFLTNMIEKDSNHWVFQKFRIVLDNLEFIISSLVEVMEKRLNYYEVKKNRLQIERIYEIRYFLNDFWIDHPARVPQGGFNIPKGFDCPVYTNKAR